MIFNFIQKTYVALLVANNNGKIKDIKIARSSETKLDIKDVTLDKNRRRAIFSSLSMIFSNCLLTRPTDAGIISSTQQEDGNSIQISVKNMCSDGGLFAEEAVPGAYQQICFQLSERKIKLQSTDDEIYILQGGINQSGSVSGRTGVYVWNSCLLLVRLFDLLGTNIFREKKVLELGCGTGLASLVAAKLGAKLVIATDGNEEVVGQAKVNIERNHATHLVRPAQLQWGSLDVAEFTEQADIIIGSDLTYNSGTWRLLADTVYSCLAPQGYFLYLSLGHSGFSAVGELSGFLEVAKATGLCEVNNPMKFFFGESSQTTNLSLTEMLLASISENDRSIIRGTGGISVVVLQKA